MYIACSPLKRKNNLRLSLSIVGCKRNQASVKLVNKRKNVNWLLLRNICEYMPNRQFAKLPVRTPFISTMSSLGCGVFSQGFSCVFGVSCAHSPYDTHTYIPVCSNHLLFCRLSKTFAPSTSSGCTSSWSSPLEPCHSACNQALLWCC